MISGKFGAQGKDSLGCGDGVDGVVEGVCMLGVTRLAQDLSEIEGKCQEKSAIANQ
jgi:hypothetical protein